jgi:predicted tellurium resistance membrane protein TerC
MFADLIPNLLTLAVLVVLETVLGLDNLLYLSIEAKRAPLEKQAWLRKVGLVLAIVLRIVMLFLVINAIQYFEKPLFSISEEGALGRVVSGNVTVHAVVVLFGGVLLLYTAIKEIVHLLAVEDPEAEANRKPASVTGVLIAMTVMNAVFSFDSVLSAMALTDVFWVMATAIVLSGILMIVMADTVAAFLKKNRLYEVLGLFVLFIIGIMLIGEGGHLAHLHLFGYAIEPMAKSTFYFTLAILVAIDVVQGRYQKKLLAERARLAAGEA